jgi:pSer/pThr/pTyr-binding forkhead associated (FHA) protein
MYYELEQSETVVGRSENCDIQLDDPYVSRRQARITQDGDRARIENLGRNPVLVNGEVTERSVLLNGDMILLGRTQLVFQLYAAGPADAAVFSDVGMDPEMTVLVPEHQALRSFAKQAPVKEEKKVKLLRTILALALLLIGAYIVYRWF